LNIKPSGSSQSSANPRDLEAAAAGEEKQHGFRDRANALAASRGFSLPSVVMRIPGRIALALLAAFVVDLQMQAQIDPNRRELVQAG
jgi:hypothetical protein